MRGKRVPHGNDEAWVLVLGFGRVTTPLWLCLLICTARDLAWISKGKGDTARFASLPTADITNQSWCLFC